MLIQIIRQLNCKLGTNETNTIYDSTLITKFNLHRTHKHPLRISHYFQRIVTKYFLRSTLKLYNP